MRIRPSAVSPGLEPCVWLREPADSHQNHRLPAADPACRAVSWFRVGWQRPSPPCCATSPTSGSLMQGVWGAGGMPGRLSSAPAGVLTTATHSTWWSQPAGLLPGQRQPRRIPGPRPGLRPFHPLPFPPSIRSSCSPSSLSVPPHLAAVSCRIF